MCAEQEDEEHNRLLASNADDEGSNKEEISQQQSVSSATAINAVYVGPKQFAISFLAFWLVAAIIAASVLHPESQNPRINTTSNNSNSTTANNEMVTQSTTTPTIKNLYPNGRPSTWPAPIYNTSFVSYLKSGMEIMLKKKQERGVHQYKYDSPFEARWPGSEQPYWARKTIPYNRHINREVCFVHVGKAGGSTVGCMLGFSLHCDTDSQIKGLVPIVTTHAFHRGVNDCADDAAYFLFVIRDPLARILSSFNYERPDMTKDDPFSSKVNTQGLYQECNFWTLEELAQKGLMNTNKDKMSRKCQGRAYEAVNGVGKYLVHGFFNYQYYAQYAFDTDDNKAQSTVPDNAKLIVIRNKHMVDDYNSINYFLGDDADALKASDIPVNNAHAKNETELYLSPSSKKALCYALCNEIQVYKDILKRAINLNEQDIEDSMEEVRNSCPKEAEETTCFEDRPNIHGKVNYRRGEPHSDDDDDRY